MKLYGEECVLDNVDVKGFGKMGLEDEEKSQAAKFRISDIKDIVDIAEKMGWDEIIIRIENNKPVFISREKEDMIGILLAPMKEVDYMKNKKIRIDSVEPIEGTIIDHFKTIDRIKDAEGIF